MTLTLVMTSAVHGVYHQSSDLYMLGVYIIKNEKQRNLWFHSHPKGVKGYYAYGAKELKCQKTSTGYRIKRTILPDDTPIYRYGFPTSKPMTVPHGAFVYQCQLPGVDLADPSTIEEQLFPYSDRTLPRTTKKKLKVRCGKGFYRIVLLDAKVTEPFCYVFGTNIRLPTQDVPTWMRRNTIVLPHPRRTSRDAMKSHSGKVYRFGRPKVGPVTICGIPMKCTCIRQLCTIYFEGQRYYAHASVVFRRDTDT